MNIKNIRIRSKSEQPVELRLEKKGAGPVLASDITLANDIEVVNPDAVICNIDDPKANVIIDFVVETGRGYRTIEESSSNRLFRIMASDYAALNKVPAPLRRLLRCHLPGRC